MTTPAENLANPETCIHSWDPVLFKDPPNGIFALGPDADPLTAPADPFAPLVLTADQWYMMRCELCGTTDYYLSLRIKDNPPTQKNLNLSVSWKEV